MPYLLSTRHFALFLLLVDLWCASAYENGIVYVLLVDGLALALILFAREIDDLTFGAAARGVGLPDRVDAHIPPFLIAMFGWLLLLFNTVMLLVLAWQGVTRIG